MKYWSWVSGCDDRSWSFYLFFLHFYEIWHGVSERSPGHLSSRQSSDTTKCDAEIPRVARSAGFKWPGQCFQIALLVRLWVSVALFFTQGCSRCFGPVTQARAIVESVQQKSGQFSYARVLRTYSDNLAVSRAASNSSRVMEVFLNGAARFLLVIKCDECDSSRLKNRKYTTAAYSVREASPNTCIWPPTTGEAPFRTQRGIFISLTAGSPVMNADHRPANSSGIGWSQRSSSFQRAWKIILRTTMAGPKFPSGSNSAAVMIRILR